MGFGKRECIIQVVSGKQRIGKSNESLRMIMEDYLITTLEKKGRKCLIVDVNNEYGEYKVYSKKAGDQKFIIYPIKRIRISDIAKFTAQQKIEVCRVVPTINDDGTLADAKDQLPNNIVSILDNFRGGCIIMEDMNKIYGDNLPVSVSGLLCNVAHRDADLILHIQSVGRLLPKMLQNTSIIRVHYQLDRISDSKTKLGANYEILGIADALVETEYHRYSEEYPEGNTRFFVYVDRNEQKIFGKFSEKMLYDAITNFIKSNRSTTNLYELERHPQTGKKVYTYQQSVLMAAEKLFRKYNGNKKAQAA